MIKNNSGVTLMILIVTIIILLILTGVGLNLSFDVINDVRDSKLDVELGVVRQAVIEYYEKMKAVGKEDENVWIGDPVVENNILVPKGIENPFEDYEYNESESEKNYYRLTPKDPDDLNDTDDFAELGIGDVGASSIYVVNYSTGEVYNESKQTYHTVTDQLLYLSPINYNNSSDTEDTESFNDWPNSFDTE